MEKTIILLRGLPGSGKSTTAKTFGLPTFEADDFFYEDGEYKFDHSKIRDAHKSCQDRVRFAMENGINKLIVSNTFTEEWEMEYYFNLANELNYRVTSLIVENRHGNKSVHDVPQETINRMNNRFDIKL